MGSPLDQLNEGSIIQRRRFHFDGTGLWLMTKRLEKGTFAWPKVEPGQLKVTLRPEALEMLLAVIDLKDAKLHPWWEVPSSADHAERGDDRLQAQTLLHPARG